MRKDVRPREERYLATSPLHPFHGHNNPLQILRTLNPVPQKGLLPVAWGSLKGLSTQSAPGANGSGIAILPSSLGPGSISAVMPRLLSGERFPQPPSKPLSGPLNKVGLFLPAPCPSDGLGRTIMVTHSTALAHRC